MQGNTAGTKAIVTRRAWLAFAAGFSIALTQPRIGLAGEPNRKKSAANTAPKTHYLVSAALREGVKDFTFRLVHSVQSATSVDEVTGIFTRLALEKYPGYAVAQTTATDIVLPPGTCLAGQPGSPRKSAQTLYAVSAVLGKNSNDTDTLLVNGWLTSGATAAVANINDVPTGTVAINGTPTQNQTLTASNALTDADGLGAVTYQWLANGTAIAGATGSTLVLTQAQVGKAITVKAGYTDSFGATESVTSASTAAVAIAADQLWFSHAGNDLEVSIIGTADKFTVQDWYSGSQHRVERIKAGDNKVLLDTQVEALVQAMAGFAPPAMGQTTLTASQQTALAPVLAANWH